MGINDFFNIVVSSDKKTIRDLGEPITLKKFAETFPEGGLRCVVDASIAVHQAIYALKGALSSADGKNTAHLKVVFEKVLALHKYGFKQTWIFDNPISHPLKAKTQAKRKEAKRDHADNMRVTRVIIDECKKLLSLMGITCIISPPEVDAEQYAASLYMRGKCHVVISDDSDTLAFGASILRRDRSKEYKNSWMYYRIEKLNNYGLTRESLAKIAAVMGSDFEAAKTPRVGKTTVMKKLSSITLTPEQEKVYEIFMKTGDLPYKVECVKPEPFDRMKVMKFLMSYNFNPDTIETKFDDAGF